MRLPAFHDDRQPAQQTTPLPKRSLLMPALKKPNFVISVLVNAVRLLVLLVLLCGLSLCGYVAGIAKGYMETAPTLDLALLDSQDQTSFLYDCNGNVITDFKGTENRIMINISLMPENLRNAFVAVEDARFYTHNGIDVKRIIGSFVTNALTGSQQGGSTITQQLIKNAVLTSEKSYKRKIQEAYLAMQLETKYTKLQILEYYLNTIYLGENYYGVQIAAQGYFGRDPAELTMRECAMLAALTNNPYYYNPRRNFYTRTSDTTDYAAITNNRTDYVLRCMLENQFITEREYQQALNPETAHVLETSPLSGDSMYPHAHYVEYAISQVIDVLLEKNQLDNTQRNRAEMEAELRTGGYHITLAIDTDMQRILEETVSGWSKYPALRDKSQSVIQVKNSDGSLTEIVQPQAAAVILDYRTGEIKAMVGSRYTPTARKTLNRAVSMKMPVGSCIKPIAVYAPAIEAGYSPASIVYNLPLPIAGWKDEHLQDSWPKNYGGSSYTGPETLREALRNSHNVGAAQALLNMVGVDRSYQTLRQMGVDAQNIDKTPFGLALGSSGITPLQLATAYGVLANGGVYQQPIAFLGISDSYGNVIYDSHQSQETHRVFSASTAYLTVDMMKTAVNSGTATSAKIKGQTIAGKTGTNSDERGVTFCGMSGWYVSSIWVGHDEYQPLSAKTTSGNGAVPIWQSYMSKIHSQKQLQNRDIIEESPDSLGLIKVTTCAVSGQLATDACANDSMGYGVITDYWTREAAPTVSCQMHQATEVCAESRMLPTAFCPSTIRVGSVVIPYGHPLYNSYTDARYADVINQYLGTARAAEPCFLHTSAQPMQPEVNYEPENPLLTEAQQLLQSTYNLLAVLDASSPAVPAIQNAVLQLEALLTQPSPAAADLTEAMSLLTQAIAASY